MRQQMVWKCEQWLGGQVKEQSMFLSEQKAREFARKLAGASPDLVFSMYGTKAIGIRLDRVGEFGLVPHRDSKIRAVQHVLRRETLNQTKMRHWFA